MIILECSAEDIARALKGRREGRGWMARCPAHDDRTPSLSIRQADDRVLVHCFSGCSQQVVIAVLSSQGLWRERDLVPLAVRDVAKVSRHSHSSSEISVPPTDDAQARQGIAEQIWSETRPIGGTLADRYFIEHRKLDIRSLNLAHALRWHRGKQAVVALMTDAVSGKATGIHRTFLDADGAKIERKMLGRQGVIRLSPDEAVTTGLGITEGVEDGLAVLLSGFAPVWAATSSGAIARFPVLSGIDFVTIFADADTSGIESAQTCAGEWRAAGQEARVVAPTGVHHD